METLSKGRFEYLANELIKEAIKADAVISINRPKTELGVIVEVNRVAKRGVKKILGFVYEMVKGTNRVEVETSTELLKVDVTEVKAVTPVKTQSKTGFNHHKTKLTEMAVRDIYLLATTTKMTHQAIVNWVYINHGIEIVPKTVSDIKLGKRWRKLSLIERAC